MKITTVKTYVVHEKQRKNFIFIKLETDEGIAGWGEAHTSLDMDTAVAAHIEQGRQVAQPLEIKDGYIALPEAPGLGVEIDEAALARYPYQQFGKRAFRTFRDEGP